MDQKELRALKMMIAFLKSGGAVDSSIIQKFCKNHGYSREQFFDLELSGGSIREHLSLQSSAQLEQLKRVRLIAEDAILGSC